MNRGVVLITHPDCLLHNIVGHPESPARLASILKAVDGTFADDLARIEAPLATREQLLRAHSREHVESIFSSAPDSGYFPIDPDTTMMPATLNAALRAAGALVDGVDRVIWRESSRAPSVRYAHQDTTPNITVPWVSASLTTLPSELAML